MLDSLKANGMADHIGSWAAARHRPQPRTRSQQGLGSTGLIEKTAEHAGVSPSVVTSALAIILPMVIQHFAPNGQATEQSNFRRHRPADARQVPLVTDLTPNASPTYGSTRQSAHPEQPSRQPQGEAAWLILNS